MRIINAKWRPDVNRLIVSCSCRKIFAHRADRWWAHCPTCGCKENLRVLRERYCNEV